MSSHNFRHLHLAPSDDLTIAYAHVHAHRTVVLLTNGAQFKVCRIQWWQVEFGNSCRWSGHYFCDESGQTDAITGWTSRDCGSLMIKGSLVIFRLYYLGITYEIAKRQQNTWLWADKSSSKKPVKRSSLWRAVEPTSASNTIKDKILSNSIALYVLAIYILISMSKKTVERCAVRWLWLVDWLRQYWNLRQNVLIGNDWFFFCNGVCNE